MKVNRRKGISILIVSIIVLGAFCYWIDTHPTYYRYNDKWIIGKSIKEIEARYGHFDDQTNEGRKTGYYIYKDDHGPMPSHQKMYYWIYYDEKGKAVKVFEGGPLGG